MVRFFVYSFYGTGGVLFRDEKGPIEQYSFGKFIISGREHSDYEKRIGAGTDIRLIGTAASEWKDRSGHELSPSMITGVFGSGIEILIIGTGANGALKFSPEILDYVKKNDISDVVLLKTPEACKAFNEEFHKGRKVALLAHGTC